MTAPAPRQWSPATESSRLLDRPVEAWVAALARSSSGSAFFSKLGLEPAAADHRRDLAVLAFLRG
jgi:hypothetical protein